jgi:hypothetical protein
MITLSTRLKTIFDIETTIEKFTSDIINAAEIVTPMVGSGSNQITYPLEIRNLAQQKRRARRARHSIHS